jgi:predicted RNA polymerase sigma factor
MGGGAECLACPICVILQALSSARPEVMAHLLAASRELTLAFQALVDAQADAARAAATRAGGRVTRIRVD